MKIYVSPKNEHCINQRTGNSYNITVTRMLLMHTQIVYAVLKQSTEIITSAHFTNKHDPLHIPSSVFIGGARFNVGTQSTLLKILDGCPVSQHTHTAGRHHFSQQSTAVILSATYVVCLIFVVKEKSNISY